METLISWPRSNLPEKWAYNISPELSSVRRPQRGPPIRLEELLLAFATPGLLHQGRAGPCARQVGQAPPQMRQRQLAAPQPAGALLLREASSLAPDAPNQPPVPSGSPFPMTAAMLGVDARALATPRRDRGTCGVQSGGGRVHGDSTQGGACENVTKDVRGRGVTAR